jgi:serine/threonine protein kinase
MSDNIQLISQGSYGCLFQPGINCLGQIDNNKKYITKIQDDSKTTKEEFDIGTYLYLNNPYAKTRFAVIEVSCPVTLGEIHDDSIEKCELIHKNESNHVFYSNKIRYVGKYTLIKYLNLLLENKKNAFFWRAFFETQFYLLYSIQHLQEKKIVHFDIKENNIIIDDVSQLPIVIDFGISFRVDTLITMDDYQNSFDFYFRFDKIPYTWSLEILLILFIINNNGEVLFTNNIKKEKGEKSIHWTISIVDVNALIKIVDIYFDQHPIMSKIFSQKYKNIQKKKWKQWINKNFTQKTGKDIVEKLIQFWETWDTYSFSVMYFKLIRITFPTEIIEYNSILIANILALPFRRKTPLLLLNEIQDFIRTL